MNQRRELWTALLVTALVRAVTVTLLLTVFWGTPAVSHLVQDIRTWREFFAETQAGAIPHGNLTKENPVPGGVFYWLMSPVIRPPHFRQTLVVPPGFFGASGPVNPRLTFRPAREARPS